MSLENLIKLGLERNTMLYPKVTRIIDDDHVCPSDGNRCLCEKCDTDLLDDGTFECKGCDKLRYGSEESLEALTKLGLEGGHGSGRDGHQKWMSKIDKKSKAPETMDDIPIEKIDSFEGLISDYFRKRNGISYSYCMKCNASTQHLNGACRNCPEPNNIRAPIDKKVIRKPPMYDITNIAPSTDPDDAIESLMKLGLENNIDSIYDDFVKSLNNWGGDNGMDIMSWINYAGKNDIDINDAQNFWKGHNGKWNDSGDFTGLEPTLGRKCPICNITGIYGKLDGVGHLQDSHGFTYEDATRKIDNMWNNPKYIYRA